MWECAIWISEDTPLTDPAHWPPVLLKDTDASSKLGSSTRRLKWLPPTTADGLATVASAKTSSWLTAFKTIFWLAMKDRAIRGGAGWQWIDNQTDWRSGAYKRVATQGHGDRSGGRPTKLSKPGWQPTNDWREPRKLSPTREEAISHKDQRRDQQTSAGSTGTRPYNPTPPPPPDHSMRTQSSTWTPQLPQTWASSPWQGEVTDQAHDAGSGSHTTEGWHNQQWTADSNQNTNQQNWWGITQWQEEGDRGDPAADAQSDRWSEWQ